jgi:MYXO-CTERM domain-containing protein
MLALLLLLGMIPRGGDVPSGPPAPHLDDRPGEQWHLSARTSWRGFQKRWGGRWGVRWDERNATPRFLWAPGLPARDGAALVADVARLAGIDAAGLTVARTTKHDDRVITQWTRSWRGAPVEGDQIATVAIRGRIAAIWVQLTPIALGSPPRPGELILPIPPKGDARLVRRSTERGLVVYRDRSGAVVYRYDPRLYGTIDHTYEERTYGDSLVSGAARAITLTDAGGATAVTADDGSHGLAGPLDAWLDGPTVGITINGAAIHATAEADATLAAGSDIPYAAATGLHHFHVVWDWLADRWPTHRWIGSRVPLDVEQATGSCNAFYSSGTLNFFPAQDGVCNDLGRIADVVYHETGHGIHEYILAAGTFASDVSEGSADYIAATILGDPVLAPNAWTDGGYIREIDTDKAWPTDATGEPHNDGEIWSSFWWNLRGDWGADAADALFLRALEQGPTLTDAYEAVLVGDDDDGDLTNGTPHACDLMDRLAHHGLGPGPIGAVMFDHTPLGPQASAAEGYDVDFQLYDLLPDCSGLDESSVALYYTVGDAPVPSTGGPDEEPDTGDTGADTGGPPPPDTWADWESVPLTNDATGWHGTIPRQPATSHVRYFIQARSDDGTQVARADGGDEAAVYSFWVGDRRTFWCEDFEAGLEGWTHGVQGTGTVDEWVAGTPTGTGVWDPDVPIDGTTHAATVLDGDYAPNNAEYLTSPLIDASVHGPMLLLTYQRWLTVEDGRYDHAELHTADRLVWANSATASGNTHHLDVGWTSQEIPLADLLDGTGSVRLTWSLSSDQGLEYGGWAIDAVCLADLADVSRHYRVTDLEASDDADVVAVSWTQPWMKPLAATVLVRKAGGWPTGPEDGLIVDVDFFPTPGEARSVVDPDASAGETFYYALFAAGTDARNWYTAVVDGENADMGGVPAPPDDTGDTADTDDTDLPGDTARDTGGPPADDVPDDEPGCGCVTGGADGIGVGLLALGAAVATARRRRRC